jgi:hypothetical protein
METLNCSSSLIDHGFFKPTDIHALAQIGKSRRDEEFGLQGGQLA